MTPDRRRGIVAYLEAHYRRELAETIRANAKDRFRATRQEQAVSHLHIIMEELMAKVDEQEQIIMGAWAVPDDRLEDYMRVHTSPTWRRLMEESGLVWDDHFHQWRPVDD